MIGKIISGPSNWGNAGEKGKKEERRIEIQVPGFKPEREKKFRSEPIWGGKKMGKMSILDS